METNGVLNAAYDETNNVLASTSVGAASANVGTAKLDASAIWAAIYDPATNTIRTVT